MISREIRTYSAFDTVPEQDKEVLWEKGMPFYLKHPEPTDSIVICLHGYTASPYEAKPIADVVYKLGLDAAGPLLPGHGYKSLKNQKKEIARQMTFESMLKSVRTEIAEARKNYSKVYLYGQSMGGALTLAMASEGLVDACAMTAPAIKLPFGAGFSGWILGPLNITLKTKPTEAEKRFFNLSYPFVNSRSGRELQKIAIYARKNLHKITCPVLEVHSHNDGTIDPIVASWIEDRVSGPVEVAWFDKSDHTMPLDVQGREVAQKIAEFFVNLDKKLD